MVNTIMISTLKKTANYTFFLAWSKIAKFYKMPVT